jgi:hypothetical protein
VDAVGAVSTGDATGTVDAIGAVSTGDATGIVDAVGAVSASGCLATTSISRSI